MDRHKVLSVAGSLICRSTCRASFPDHLIMPEFAFMVTEKHKSACYGSFISVFTLFNSLAILYISFIFPTTVLALIQVLNHSSNTLQAKDGTDFRVAFYTMPSLREGVPKRFRLVMCDFTAAKKDLFSR